MGEKNHQFMGSAARPSGLASVTKRNKSISPWFLSWFNPPKLWDCRLGQWGSGTHQRLRGFFLCSIPAYASIVVSIYLWRASHPDSSVTQKAVLFHSNTSKQQARNLHFHLTTVDIYHSRSTPTHDTPIHVKMPLVAIFIRWSTCDPLTMLTLNPFFASLLLKNIWQIRLRAHGKNNQQFMGSAARLSGR